MPGEGADVTADGRNTIPRHMTTARFGTAPPGYRLPDATRLGRVRLQVADLSRSLAWYDGVLGFRTLRREGRTVTLAPQGDDTAIIELHERPGAVPPRGRLGLYHFAILLPDRAALGRFILHLSQVGVRAGSADHLVSEALYLQDPDGLGIEVYADRPRVLWEGRGGELAMDTLPLDARSLAQAAGGEPWTGMPPGTRLGHVHLHVGDLERATAFFHAALGLDKMVWSYPGALFLAAGGYHHHLGVNTWAGPSAMPPEEGQARLIEWEIVLPLLDDIHRAVASLEEAGVHVAHREGGWLAPDPWGTTLRLLPASA